MLNQTQQFSIDLLNQFPSGNVFISPLSIRSAMGRAMVGARGETRRQMENVLRINGTDDEIVQWLQSQENLLAGLREITFEVANKLFAQKGYGFDPAFLQRMEKMASLDQVDFHRNYEQVRHMINAWVSKQTHDKINELLGDGTLDDLTRLVIVNAVYFLGNWASQFDKDHTRPMSFETMSGRVVEALLMQQTAQFPYAESDSAQALIMPYKGGDIGLLTILPKEGKQSEFDFAVEWARLVPHLRPQKVEVYYPKFEMSWGTQNIVPAFQAMGMMDAFTQNANFTGIVGDNSLAIDGIFHQTYVKVDEVGTEAAAATAVMFLEKSIAMPAPVPVFWADHPFYYAIVTMSSRLGYNPLFIGRMEDPTK